MIKVLNRMAWILSIVVGVSIFAVDDDFFFFGLIAIFVTKFILSNQFIKASIEEFEVNFQERLSVKKSSSKIVVSKDIKTKEIEVQKEEIKEIKEQKNIVKDEKIVSIKKEVVKIPKEPSKIEKFLTEFFAENLMAKIGGILLTLGIIFLMSLVYTLVGPVLKIIIGFAVGFIVYFIGAILNKKGFKTESMILLGTGILINYVVILGGRFIIGENEGLLSSSITFLFLILNTIFSILTSYIYNSKNLLLFSVLFAFVIPFLTGGNASTPHILVGYGLVVSFGALITSNYFAKNKISGSLELFFISLIGGNILFLVAPFGDNSNYFVLKMIAFNILNFLAIFLAYKNKFSKSLLPIFIISFIFLGLIMFSGAALSSLWILISFIIGTIGLLIGTSFFVALGIGSGLIYLLFLPILFALGFIFIGGVGSSVILLPLFLVAYLGVFAFGIGNILASAFKYVFFSFIGIFLVIGNINLSINLENITMPIFLVMALTGFLFIFSTYFLSSKKDLSYLYTIGTLAGIFILLPILKITGELTQVSIIALALFGLINYLTPFFNSNLVKNDSANLVLGNVFGILFIGGNLFRFGDEYFPGVTLGISFFALAILYFAGGFVLFGKFEKKETKEKESNLNFIYTFLAIAVSLFSISVALVFSSLPLVIGFIWLVESSIVLFFANKFNSTKVLTAGIILFIIGLVKCFSVLISGVIGSLLVYNDLLSVLLISISLLLNIAFIKNSTLTGKTFVKVLHLFGMLFVYLTIIEIITEFDGGGFEIIITGIFLGLLGIFYNLLKDNFLKSAYISLFTLVFVVHIITTTEMGDYNYNYLFTIISGVILAIEFIFFRDDNSKYLAGSFGSYLFIITSIYLYNFTQDYFSLTIYWGILSLIGVHLGISRSNKYIRAVGLYLLIITLLKISLYDIWNSIDNPIIRVIAFMFVGGIMMYISTLYSKKKLSIKNDFSFSSGEVKEVKNSISEEINVNESIKNIDVSNIESVKFSLLNGKKFTIKSKNLFRVVILIKNNLGKTSFEPNELENIYNVFVKNYKTELSETDYKKLIGAIKDFVEVGGDVEIVNKD